jgi:polyhydroxybutyrate depolymerase
VAAGCSNAGTATSTNGSSPPTTAATTAAVAPGAPVRSTGCTRPQTGPVTNQRQTVEVGGVPRWYLLDTPAPTTPTDTSADPAGAGPVARPLVLDFHGLAEGAVLHSTTTRFGVLGQKDGFVTVFPDGTGSPVHWNTSTAQPSPDLQYVSALLDQVEATRCIDTSRVYASGFSDGSFMVSLLACTMSARFTAIAAISGLQLPNPCRPARRIPILTFHGTADPILFFNGGIGTATLKRALGGGTPASPTSTTAPVKVDLHGAGYPATVQAWARKDGCNPRSTDTRISSQVIRRTYRCPPGTDVEFFIILGGGHAWPGSRFSQQISSLTGFTTFQIDATDQSWAFFRRFRL